MIRQRLLQKGKSGYSTGDAGIGSSQIGHCTLFIVRIPPGLREFPALPAPRYLPSFFPRPVFAVGAGPSTAGVAAGVVVSGLTSAGFAVPASVSALAAF